MEHLHVSYYYLVSRTLCIMFFIMFCFVVWLFIDADHFLFFFFFYIMDDDHVHNSTYQ